MRRLVTMYDGAHEAFRPVTGPSLARFAARHRYEITEAAVDSRYNPAWSKLPALADALERSEVALWVDADVFIIDHGRDPADVLSGDVFMAILTDDRYGVCSALFALRACPTSRRFLDQAWAMRERNFPDWDQGAIHELVARSEYERGVLRLGNDWYGPEGGDQSRIVHGCRQTASTVPERAERLRARVAVRGGA